MEGLLNLGKLFAPELGSQGIREAEAAQLPGGMAALLAPQRFNNIRKASGGLFGVDTSTSKERLQKALGQLDMSTPQGQAKAVELVRTVDPAIAAQMQQQFKVSRESSALNQAQVANQNSQVTRRTQQTALETAARADDVTQREQGQANLEAAKPATIKALVDAREANPTLLTDDLISAVQNNTMSPADVQTTLNNRLKLSTEAKEWIRVNNNTILQRGTGTTRELPTPRNVTPFEVGGMLIGVDTSTGETVYTKNIADIVDPSSGASDTATTIVPRQAAAPLAAPPATLTEAQRTYKGLLNKKLIESQSLLQQIGSAKSLISGSSSGMFPNIVRAINPEVDGDLSEALFAQGNTNLRAAINPVVASLGFDELQGMRSDPDNKTGGALGQVSNIELKMLQSAIADLGTEQSPALLRASLEKIERHYTNFLQAELGIVPEIDITNPVYGGNVGINEAGEYIIRDSETGEAWVVGPSGSMLTLKGL
jgi:hypothetical protein